MRLTRPLVFSNRLMQLTLDSPLTRLSRFVADLPRFLSRGASDGRSYDYHKTVLLDESVDAAMGENDAPVIVDGTFGGGGHTELFLKRGARVIAIDRDPEALERGQEIVERYGEQLTLVEGNFADIETHLKALGISRVDGVLVDLGVSSRQLDAAERGFSFMRNGPLDMRMGRDVTQTAADLVNTLDEGELADIIYKYGEDRASRRIARAICERRRTKAFTETLDLADCIAGVVRKSGKIHPATRTFQALRIAVNGELDAVEKLLTASRSVLAPGGRLAVISFHSLEDRLVKLFLKHAATPELDRPEWPAPRPNPDHFCKLVTRKPILAGPHELEVNARSRSAKLRVAEVLNPKPERP